MERIEIKDGKIFLSGNEISGVEKIKLKSTAKDGHAEVYLKLFAKLA
ncbi:MULTISPECIES: hypothetical protein [Streptococcus]|nr:hypothetical protein [Streptococcus canis]VTS69575.1 Uncharacterised protein [Streptococcus canis]VTS75439.1 Uncharacterised protein [Streptococcus canis]GAY70513.1 uncharacterized protein TANIYAMA4_0920 [Streptococcus canis]GAY71816.1 uncharacterized protein TANIYAMA4_2526 [Streptococcus canis]GFE45986.1 hypothetical protein ScFU6_17550 [Streptococcus canis]